MLTRNLRVTLIEHNVTWGDRAANMDCLDSYMANLPDGTDVVVLPEMFSTGLIDDSDLAAQLAERNSGDTIQRLQQLADKHSVAIAGSFLAHTASRLYNRGFFIEPHDDETFYDKSHLFGFGGEDKVYGQGTDAAPIVRFRGMNIKLIVCYDLRFPVFCRNVGNAYDALLVIANWPTARINAWRTLLAARAIENECYVCGVNRCGSDPSGINYGNGTSMIFDFKGKCLAQSSEQSPLAVADLSPSELEKFRAKFPAWRDADAFTMRPKDL